MVYNHYRLRGDGCLAARGEGEGFLTIPRPGEWMEKDESYRRSGKVWLGRLGARKNRSGRSSCVLWPWLRPSQSPLLSQMTTPGLDLNFSVSDDNMQQDSDEF